MKHIILQKNCCSMTLGRALVLLILIIFSITHNTLLSERVLFGDQLHRASAYIFDFLVR